MENQPSLPPVWWLPSLISLLTTLTAIIVAFWIRSAYHACFTKYDRSILIWLGTKEAEHLANVPLIVGTFPFTPVGEKMESNLDARNVIGFIIGEPKWVCREECLGTKVATDTGFLEGYYAYCVVQWEHAQLVERFWRQGFHIRETSTQVKGGRESKFIGFGTDAEPDEKTQLPKHIVHIQKGLFASWKYQPYKKGGFYAEDITTRALAWQTRRILNIKQLFKKR